MKKLLLCILLVLCIPTMKVNAADYNLKNGKTMSGAYAGEEEGVYNYYKITPSKSGYIEITANTSDGKKLIVDICNKDKNVIASEVAIKNKKTVLHKVNKKTVYYLRIKGTPDATYKISYKLKTFDTLTYAKKYSYAPVYVMLAKGTDLPKDKGLIKYVQIKYITKYQLYLPY